MAKKRKELTEEEKHLKMMDKCRPFYEAFKDELNLEGDEIGQIHQLVKAGCELQCQICTEADKINIDGFEKAQEMLTIDKGTWSEFVKTVAKKMYGNLSEKSLEKMNESIELKRYLSNLRQSFYDSYLADENMKIVDESGESDFKFDEIEDQDFAKHIEENAKIRDYINNVLYKRYDSMAKAAYFITDGKIKKADFKDLVDWEYYKDSENPKYPSRSWTIYNKFNRMYRLLSQYEFDQIEDLDYEFGCNIELGTQHPTIHPWQIEEGETTLD